jgi:hypothetical protein
LYRQGRANAALLDFGTRGGKALAISRWQGAQMPKAIADVLDEKLGNA